MISQTNKPIITTSGTTINCRRSTSHNSTSTNNMNNLMGLNWLVVSAAPFQFKCFIGCDGCNR